jgi:hypothetical protein
MKLVYVIVVQLVRMIQNEEQRRLRAGVGRDCGVPGVSF